MQVIKASGEREPYSREKFCASLRRAGALEGEVNRVCRVAERVLKTEIGTHDLFKAASRELVKINPAIAARYGLKHGMLSLGPAGFLFERYVEVILQSLGYHTRRNVIMEGVCVEHEVDVVAHKGDEHFLVEAKYRNTLGDKTDVTVAMYADARLQDITPRQEKGESGDKRHSMWLITNAKFTSTAITYGKCRNLKMTGWSYPKGEESLEEIIRTHNLYPVTVLPSVSRYEREAFAAANLILAQDVAPFSAEELQQRFSISKNRAEKIRREAELLVSGSES